MLSDAAFLVKHFFQQNGLDIIVGASFFALAVLFAYLVGRTLNYVLRDRLHVDRKIVAIIVRTFRIAIITLAVITLLGEFGIQVASLLTGLGVAGFALALGARVSINNAITGMMVSALSPYEEGDMIEAERVKGVVESISLFQTVVVTNEGEYVSVPNGPMWAKSIRNLSRVRPGVLEFTIETEIFKGLGALVAALKSAALEEKRRSNIAPPLVEIETVTAEKSILRAVVWCDGEHAGEIGGDLAERFKGVGEQAGIPVTSVEWRFGGKPVAKKKADADEPGNDDFG